MTEKTLTQRLRELLPSHLTVEEHGRSEEAANIYNGNEHVATIEKVRTYQWKPTRFRAYGSYIPLTQRPRNSYVAPYNWERRWVERKELGDLIVHLLAEGNLRGQSVRERLTEEWSDWSRKLSPEPMVMDSRRARLAMLYLSVDKDVAPEDARQFEEALSEARYDVQTALARDLIWHMAQVGFDADVRLAEAAASA